MNKNYLRPFLALALYLLVLTTSAVAQVESRYYLLSEKNRSISLILNLDFPMRPLGSIRITTFDPSRFIMPQSLFMDCKKNATKLYRCIISTGEVFDAEFTDAYFKIRFVESGGILLLKKSTLAAIDSDFNRVWSAVQRSGREKSERVKANIKRKENIDQILISSSSR